VTATATWPGPGRPADPAAAAPYLGPLDHLADELLILDQLIRLRVARVRRAGRLTPEGQLQRAVYVSHDEADELLDADYDAAAGVGLPGPGAELGVLRARVAARVERSRVRLTLPQLVSAFGLSPFEAQVIVICLAPELRRRYDRLYAYLQDDITRKRPSLELVLDLLCDSETDRWQRLPQLGEGSPLRRTGLLKTVDDPHSPSGAGSLAQFVQLDPHILRFLLGDPGPDPRLADRARLEPLPPLRTVPEVDSVVLNRVSRLVAGRLAGQHHGVVQLHGPSGAGARELAAAACAGFGIPLLWADAAALAAAPDGPELIRLAIRDGALLGCAVHLARADALLRESARPLLAALGAALTQFGGPGRLVFLAGTAGWTDPDLLGGPELIRVEIPAPDARLRTTAWRQALGSEDPEADSWAAQLGSRYRLTQGRIRAAVRTARAGAGPDRLGPEAFAAACRDQSSDALGTLAVKVRPRYGWDDLILPGDRLALLGEVCAQIRHHDQVFGDWGFGRRVAHGRGLSALFSGPPGTGKTLAAEVMAGQAGLDLYKVDLAGVVSKYIGETERNLARVFDEAQNCHAILFFDEADALFGKRTEVSDAHDRYANIEISYLLQRMEDFDGVVVLATNLRQNLDEAFTRRIRFLVDFPFPDALHREQIWRTHLPASAPLADDIDCAELARLFPVSGGGIKNVALNAAFLAADEGGPIAARHLLHGLRREFEKVGKVWTEPARGPERRKGP
jgi:ATPase family associated with various cellular activities (AAA)